MDRYMIESPHDEGDCNKIIDKVTAAGYLHHFEWGCHDGVHCGWAFVETDSLEHAKQIIPWEVRGKARIIKVENFAETDKNIPHQKE